MKPRRLHSATILSMVTTSSGMARAVATAAARALALAAESAEARRPILRPRMPIYEYRRPDGTTFEVLQKITDDPLTTTRRPACRSSASSTPVAVHFKGKGFYNTDYGTEAPQPRARDSRPRTAPTSTTPRRPRRHSGRQAEHAPTAEGGARARQPRRPRRLTRRPAQRARKRRDLRDRFSDCVARPSARAAVRQRRHAGRLEDARRRRAATVATPRTGRAASGRPCRT